MHRITPARRVIELPGGGFRDPIIGEFDFDLGSRTKQTVWEFRGPQQRQHERERRLNASKLIQRVWRGHRARRELARGKISQLDTANLEPLHEVSFDDGEFFDHDVFNEDFTDDFEFLFSEPSAELVTGLPPESSLLSDAPSVSECTTQLQPACGSTADFQDFCPSYLPDNGQHSIAPAMHDQYQNHAPQSQPSSNLDMNEPTVLQLYTQLVVFQQDTSRTSITFADPSASKQDLLYGLARKIGLEFKHTLHPAEVTISRQSQTFPLNTNVSRYTVPLPSYGMPYYPAPATLTEKSQFSPGFHSTLPATPPDESMMTPDEITQTNDTSNGLFEIFDTDRPQADSWADLFPKLAEFPGPYQQDYYGRGSHSMTFRQPAPRQRTAIACRYCRRRKIRCAGYDQDPKGCCTNCRRFQQDCIFTPSPMPRYLPTPAFVTPQMEYTNLQRKTMYGSGKGVSAGDEITTMEMQLSLPAPITTGSVPSNIPQERANLSHRPQAHTSHEFVLDLDCSVEKGKKNSLGRQGPLNESSRANSKAVKAVGACWKCKVIRKKCDDAEVCHNCVKGEENSLWKDIGCRRRPLKAQLPKAVFCPRYKFDGENILFTPRMTFLCEKMPCDLKAEGVGNGVCACIPYLIDADITGEKETLEDLRKRVMERIYAVMRYSTDSDLLFEHPGPSIFHGYGQPLFGRLSVFAVQRFSRPGPSEYESIIRRSLECLLYGLEAMHTCSAELRLSTHEGCTAMKCGVSPAKNIQDCRGRYINELSQQIFKKKNLRGDKSWWLPTCCSLVIQGFVFETIKATSTSEKELDENYLHPAVRLFLSVSPKDMKDTDDEFGELLLSFGFKSPAECLQNVFGMLGRPAKSARASNEPATPSGNGTLPEIAEELEAYDQVSNPSAFIQRQITRTDIDITKDQLRDTQMIDDYDDHDYVEDGCVSWPGQSGKRRLNLEDDDGDEIAHVATAKVRLLVEKRGEAIEIPNLSSNVSASDKIFPETHRPRENLEAYATLEKDLERELKYGYGLGHADLDAAEARDMLRARRDACQRPRW